MTIFRRRTLFWLGKAYLRKWGKVIGSSFVLGLLIFFLLLAFSQYIIKKLPTEKKVVVGMIGAYTPSTLPSSIISKLSQGLTKVQPDGTVVPEAASSWDIRDNGKTYVFHLRNGIQFSNGRALTADAVRYDFADVRTERPNDQTIVFRLKDAYSPFLTTVSRPLFINGFVGIGDYRIGELKLNGSFVEHLELRSRDDARKTETYKFYPTEDALKHAYLLGEINTAIGLTELSYKDTNFSSFPNVTVSKQIDYTKLVTLFFNTRDSVISDKKVRNGLEYALPDEFSEGQRNYVSYPPTSQFFARENLIKKQNLPHAKELVGEAKKAASSSASLTLHMKVLSKYMPVAKTIQSSWEQAGVAVALEEVDSIPLTFQMYLGDFNVPRDPDQYTLWHSSQPASTNITNFNNLRIDKLLEDGRKTTDVQKRKEIYADFQKYLLDDAPAAFLYFPYSYTIARK